MCLSRPGVSAKLCYDFIMKGMKRKRVCPGRHLYMNNYYMCGILIGSHTQYGL